MIAVYEAVAGSLGCTLSSFKMPFPRVMNMLESNCLCDSLGFANLLYRRVGSPMSYLSIGSPSYTITTGCPRQEVRDISSSVYSLDVLFCFALEFAKRRRRLQDLALDDA